MEHSGTGAVNLSVAEPIAEGNVEKEVDNAVGENIVEEGETLEQQADNQKENLEGAE